MNCSVDLGGLDLVAQEEEPIYIGIRFLPFLRVGPSLSQPLGLSRCELGRDDAEEQHDHAGK